jgi:hypothetical protein
MGRSSGASAWAQTLRPEPPQHLGFIAPGLFRSLEIDLLHGRLVIGLCRHFVPGRRQRLGFIAPGLFRGLEFDLLLGRFRYDPGFLFAGLPGFGLDDLVLERRLLVPPGSSTGMIQECPQECPRLKARLEKPQRPRSRRQRMHRTHPKAHRTWVPQALRLQKAVRLPDALPGLQWPGFPQCPVRHPGPFPALSAGRSPCPRQGGLTRSSHRHLQHRPRTSGPARGPAGLLQRPGETRASRGTGFVSGPWRSPSLPARPGRCPSHRGSRA